MRRKNLNEEGVINIFEHELSVSKSNNQYITSIYEQGLAFLESSGTRGKYEWQSDVNIPEFFSSFITELSMVSSQYFQTRDFVEIYLEGDRKEDKLKCEAAKILINKILNRRELHHYVKLIRASAIRQLAGVVYLLCWWEQEIVHVPEIQATPSIIPSEDLTTPPTVSINPQTVYREKIVKDWFNYEVIDPRNVFVSPEYTYSVQDKLFVIIRHEKTIESIIQDAERCNYFNIDKLKSLIPPTETETAKESYNKEQKYSFPYKTVSRFIDVYERFGKFWAVVRERDQYGNPLRISIGVDSRGVPLPNAELVETIITIARVGTTSVLIRFDPQRNIDSRGRPYRPIIRGVYYIHPSRSEGITDTSHAINLQEAINDTINISNDRVMLATFPAFKIRKYAVDNLEDIYIAPDHPIPLEDPNTDLQELKISDNIQGAMIQTNLLINQLHQLRAIFPTTMGNIGTLKSSMTATAVAGAEQRTDMRQSYKAMCFEYTFLCDLYWMILQMAYQYMHPVTMQEILGNLVPYFDPDADYTYKPVTSAVELEHSKNVKIKNYMTLLQTVASIKHPETVKLINYILIEVLKLMGAEYSVLKDYLLSPEIQAKPSGSTPAPSSPPSSNQYGIMMSDLERFIRESKK